MSIALVEQLNFEKQIPIDGNCKQQISIAVPCTGANAYPLGSYFMINVPQCGPYYVLNPMNTFLRFYAYISDVSGVLELGYSCDSPFQRFRYYMVEMLLK